MPVNFLVVIKMLVKTKTCRPFMEATGLLGQVSSLGSLCPSRPALGLKDLPLGVRVVISGPADPHALINLSQPRSAPPVQGSLEPVPGTGPLGPRLHYAPLMGISRLRCFVE